VIVGFALALLIGLVLGVLGGGGAILTIPVLHHVMGYTIRQAVPMSLVVVGITSAAGAVGHWRQGLVQLRTAAGFGIPAMLGAVLGADVGPRVRDDIRLTVFAAVLLGAAFAMYRGTRVRRLTLHPDPSVPESPRFAHPALGVTLIGGGVGFLTGFVGVGGGFLYVPVLTVLAGLPVRESIGTSLVLIVLSCAAGIARYLGNAELRALDWTTVAWFTGIALVGVVLGTRLVPYVSQQKLRRGFAALLLVLGLVVMFVR
jgi:uncharacterized membrane protein YfcA